MVLRDGNTGSLRAGGGGTSQAARLNLPFGDGLEWKVTPSKSILISLRSDLENDNSLLKIKTRWGTKDMKPVQRPGT